jgi:nicotinate-nucleotide pyrophosphorylase (carboxylating)
MWSRALTEDVGAADLTAGLVDPDRRARATVVAREPAVICGAPWVRKRSVQVDPDARELSWNIPEGQRCDADQTVLEVRGQARASADGRAYGAELPATAQRRGHQNPHLCSGHPRSAGVRAAIVDTRKTLPGLRLAQKYAVHTVAVSTTAWVCTTPC